MNHHVEGMDPAAQKIANQELEAMRQQPEPHRRKPLKERQVLLENAHRQTRDMLAIMAERLVALRNEVDSLKTRVEAND